MKTALIPLALAALLLPLAGAAGPPPAGPPAAAITQQVYFSPDGGCTAAVVKEIDAETHSIHVLAYSFTSTPIAQALVRAKRRGVDVEAVLDKSQPTAHGNQIAPLLAASIPTYIDHKHAIQHQKAMLFGALGVVENGSFNYTDSAEHHNSENALFTAGNVPLLDTWEANFAVHRGHSVEALPPPAKMTRVPALPAAGWAWR